jgi:predicted nucleic-acid-binding Zn-ribbon protein
MPDLLEPLPSGIVQVDTLKEVKKVAAFTSHRLDYLGMHLLGEGKMETSKNLWMRVIHGDSDAVKEMTLYNKKDVQLLEDVYLKIRPYMKGHPHLGVLHGEERNHSCPKCGSSNMIQSKVRYSAAGVKKIQKQCNDCHGYSTFTFKVEPDEQKNP